ncbi:RHS repeat domain-containing protein, partial [Massilia sp. SM-13]|uniref:RHS repeat domain-containing protein n=1 Tax=Pseudoduganella rhizocola TaxID=3382643 RepID=UPI0038B649E3
GVTDNRGFTGHEMLDQLDLVHMNGRIYEPLIARFLSADPLIQDPMHSQSYNRYAYVWNNPTNLTDPTGFAGVEAGKAEEPKRTVADQVQTAWEKDCSKPNTYCTHSRGSSASDNTKDGKGKGVPKSANTKGVLERAVDAVQGELKQQKNYLEYNLEHPMEALENAAAPFGAGGAIVGSFGKGGRIASWFAKLFSKEEVGSDAFQGVKAASQYLQEIGVSRSRRVEILQSFEIGTINLRSAGHAEYGLRYFDNIDALAPGRYLFETFPATRASLALASDWNKMTNVVQWQIRPGSLLIEGRAAAQGVGLPGGQVQKFVPYVENLIKPSR